MKGMNDIICTMQENVGYITGNLNKVMFAKERLETLEGHICSYMGDRSSTLDLAKYNLDKLALSLVDDLIEELSGAIADIEADEDEVNAYAAMFAEDDHADLPADQEPEAIPDQEPEAEQGKEGAE